MMQIISVETTPNPNSMKLNTDQHFNTGTFSFENVNDCPKELQPLLQIERVQSIFIASHFITLNRDPRGDWRVILSAAESLLSGSNNATKSVDAVGPKREAALGEIQVLVQTFRGIPMQVKVNDGVVEKRLALSERFTNTARELQVHFGAAFIQEREWINWGVRYGELDVVAQDVVDEIEGVQNASALEKTKQVLLGNESSTPSQADLKQKTDADINSENWHDRLRALEQIDLTEASIPQLAAILLNDQQPQLRRWVAAKLGTLESSKAVPYLCQALEDTHVGVRRTAGDSLSDIGDPSAEVSVCKVLSDKNKLVRWRAARYLAELGTASSLPFLEKALNDSEYEVHLEVKAAIEYIRGDSKAAGPIWKQMSQESN